MQFQSFAAFVALSLFAVANASPQASKTHTNKRFHPKVKFEVFGHGVEAPASTSRKRRIEDLSTSFFQHKLGINHDQVIYKSGYSSDIVDHAYVRQVHNNITFTNAVGNIAMKEGKVVAFGSSFVSVDEHKIAPSTPSIEASSAIATAEKILDGTYNGHPTTLEYFVKEDGSVPLVHVVQIKNPAKRTWYQAHVDAHTGELVSTTDFVAHLFYEAIFITRQSILDGQLILYNPQDYNSSPLGWHSNGSPVTNTTSGNNVIATNYITKRPTYQSSAPVNFAFNYNTTLDPTKGTNPDASNTNAFYIMNSVHDFSYLYGFTEAAFNFQTNNFGKGGAEGDPVFVTVQDTSNFNTITFATPPDGQPAECHMYLYNTTSPRRDSSMDVSMLVHEATHGISNRLTGGGSADCLGSTISAGLGEGWSDMMADWTEQTFDSISDFTFARYLFNSTNGGGMRTYPYSTNKKTNPLRFSSLNNFPTDVHRIGEVWANMLHNVYAVLVQSFGFSGTARVNPDVHKGNVIFMRLFMDALSLQPCEPSFSQARDAIIQADVNRYNGSHVCMIWKAFASRGLGVNAVDSPGAYIDGSNVPAQCSGSA